MQISQSIKAILISHAINEMPNECCGILASKNGVAVKHYPITNTEQSPYRYSMDGKQVLNAYNEIEDNGWDLGVIYHSHTHTPAYPSATDVRLATWPDAEYILISLMNPENPQIQNFRIVEGEIFEASLIFSE
tara:strand:- start:6911 stop:7309 length:399 start_codon:yes stop_codon:yes gene_type:complete